MIATAANRLTIEEWSPALNTPSVRRQLELALSDMLTPAITRYLPMAMQFAPATDSISQWMADRQNEAQVLSVQLKNTATLAGLILLHEAPATDAPISEIHLGYFLGEPFWGQGYATEMITTLIGQLHDRAPIKLIAGVDHTNTASARVLLKADFTQRDLNSTETQLQFELHIT